MHVNWFFAHPDILFQVVRRFSLADPHFRQVRYEISKRVLPSHGTLIFLQGEVFPRMTGIEGRGSLFSLKLGVDINALPEFSQLVELGRLSQTYRNRVKRDRRLSDKSKQIATSLVDVPDLSNALYQSLEAAYREFSEMMLPAPQHEELFGSG
jgi:hypothetical protein